MADRSSIFAKKVFFGTIANNCFYFGALKANLLT
jgi:hypothetical protein